MDTARDKHTLELVEGEELWSLETVDREGYICRGCDIQVFPASFDKERNKKRPYFSLGPSNKHKDGCDVDGEEKVIKRAKKSRVGTPEGFPLPFPSKLTLTDERRVSPDGTDTQWTSGGERTGSRSGEGGAVPRKHHGHTVKTIRPACRTFVNFPNDREFLPLEIPGVTGNTYGKIFTYVKSGKPEPLRPPTRLIFATIRWMADPVITKTHCDLTLNAGEWDQEKGGYKSLSTVRVHWADWSQSRKDALMREFTATRVEASEQAKDNKQVKGWIFFVGTQDPSDPGVFHADNHRLICCLPAEMAWPSKK